MGSKFPFPIDFAGHRYNSSDASAQPACDLKWPHKKVNCWLHVIDCHVCVLQLVLLVRFWLNTIYATAKVSEVKNRNLPTGNMLAQLLALYANHSRLHNHRHIETTSTKTYWITFRGHSRSHVIWSPKRRWGIVQYCIIMWALEPEI